MDQQYQAPQNIPTNSPSNSPLSNQFNMPNGNGSSKKGLITAIIVVLVLVAALAYLYISRMNRAESPVTETSSSNQAATAPTQTSDDSQTAATANVRAVTNTNDDVSSLQTDLDASTNGLDNTSF